MKCDVLIWTARSRSRILIINIIVLKTEKNEQTFHLNRMSSPTYTR
jgi:hypothetical protein